MLFWIFFFLSFFRWLLINRIIIEKRWLRWLLLTLRERMVMPYHYYAHSDKVFQFNRMGIRPEFLLVLHFKRIHSHKRSAYGWHTEKSAFYMREWQNNNILYARMRHTYDFITPAKCWKFISFVGCGGTMHSIAYMHPKIYDLMPINKTYNINNETIRECGFPLCIKVNCIC